MVLLEIHLQVASKINYDLTNFWSFPVYFLNSNKRDLPLFIPAYFCFLIKKKKKKEADRKTSLDQETGECFPMFCENHLLNWVCIQHDNAGAVTVPGSQVLQKIVKMFRLN